MIQGVHSNKYRGFVRTSARQKAAQREIVQPNQIFITDFSPVQPHYERKKKRCPLFLLNRSTNRKSNKKGSIFTSQGIVLQTAIDPQKYPIIGQKKSLNSCKDKVSSSLPRKQMLTSAYNFTKTKTSKNTLQSRQTIGDFPLFYFYPQNRFLQSSFTEREEMQAGRKWHRKTMSNAKDRLRSEGGEFEGNNLGAWRTIEVDFDEVI